jgi:hypothetical protein
MYEGNTEDFFTDLLEQFAPSCRSTPCQNTLDPAELVK